MIIKTTPDKNKASALIIMAEITLERLKSTDKLKYPANTLNDYYDIIHKLMEAAASINGMKIKGDGAHKELIDFISASMALSEGKRVFLQQLREYRNRMHYEGFAIRDIFINANEALILEIINTIKEHLKGRI